MLRKISLQNFSSDFNICHSSLISHEKFMLSQSEYGIKYIFTGVHRMHKFKLRNWDLSRVLLKCRVTLFTKSNKMGISICTTFKNFQNKTYQKVPCIQT